MKEVPLDIAYRLINHSPIVLVSSVFRDKIGILPIAWYMPLSKFPLQIGLKINTTHHTAKLILDSQKLTINIPHAHQIDMIMKCGSSHGDKVNKFKEYDIPIGSAKTSKNLFVKSCAGYMTGKLMDTTFAMEHEIFKVSIDEAWVDKNLFSDRWLIESNPNARLLHHMGNGYFSADGDLVNTN